MLTAKEAGEIFSKDTSEEDYNHWLSITDATIKKSAELGKSMVQLPKEDIFMPVISIENWVRLLNHLKDNGYSIYECTVIYINKSWFKKERRHESYYVNIYW